MYNVVKESKIEELPKTFTVCRTTLFRNKTVKDVPEFWQHYIQTTFIARHRDSVQTIDDNARGLGINVLYFT